MGSRPRGHPVRVLIALFACGAAALPAALAPAPAAADTTCPTITLTPWDPSYYVLPDGNPNTPYSTTITASGGSGNYYWQLIGGSLPAGLTWSPQGFGGDTLTISGTPTQVGQYGVSFGAENVVDGHTDGCPGKGGSYQINIPAADLSVGQSVSDATIHRGHQETLTVDVLNSGPNPASNVQLDDTLPQQLEAVSAMWSPAVGQQIPCTITSPKDVHCALGDLSDGSHDDANHGSVTVVANAIAVGTGTTTATVSSGTYDPQPSNNSADATVEVDPPTADLTALVDVKTVRAHTGEQIRYVATVVNGGPDPAPRARLTTDYDDSDGAWVKAVSVSPADCSERLPVKCSFGTLDPGDSVKVHVTVHVKRRPSDRHLAFDAEATGDVNDPRPDNNRARDDVVVEPAADLSVFVSPVDTLSDRGSAYVRFHMYNDGPDFVGDGRLSVHFSQPGELYPLQTGGANCDEHRRHAGHILCTHIALSHGEHAVVAYRYVLHDDPGDARITITAHLSSRTFDPEKSNNHDSRRAT